MGIIRSIFLSLQASLESIADSNRKIAASVGAILWLLREKGVLSIEDLQSINKRSTAMLAAMDQEQMRAREKRKKNDQTNQGEAI